MAREGALDGSCQLGGNPEILYTFTAQAGQTTLDLTLESATDQGMYVRTDCVSAGSEVGCADAELGGTNEGDPGSRIEDVFYGAYFRDPDGNKAVFYQFG